jgi:hypothetical protein
VSASKFRYDVTQVADGKSGLGRTPAKAWLKAVAKRDELLANTTARDGILRALTSAIRASGSGLVFAPTEQSAGHAARVLEGQGCFARLVDPESGQLRARRAERSVDDDVCLLASPRDLGTETATTEPGIVVALGDSRTARQLIQRLGHVLARQDGDRHARVVVICVEGSVEDDGARSASPYIAGITPHAAKVEHFTGTETDALHAFIGTHALA